MRTTYKITNTWAAGRVVGDATATSHTSKLLHLGVEIAWKRGPRGQGWYFGSNGSWKGCYKTSEAAYNSAMHAMYGINWRQQVAA